MHCPDNRTFGYQTVSIVERLNSRYSDTADSALFVMTVLDYNGIYPYRYRNVEMLLSQLTLTTFLRFV